jgi:phosphate/sulfate permease
MTRGKFWLWVSVALGVVYTLYVVWAKFAKTIGPPPIRLSETSEFLLFLAVIVAFTLQVIREERTAPPRAHATEDERL